MRFQFQAIMLAAVALGFGQSKQSDTNRKVGISDRVPVDVYLSDHDDSSVLVGPEATAVVSGIFKGIGIRLKWRRGDVRAGRSSHRDGAFPPAFGVRTVERAPDSVSANALASAELLGSSGAEITIYKERFLRFLADHPHFPAAAAGYVLAHELAHVMQGAHRHSEAGILKAQWSTDDLRQMMTHKLAFTTLDVELIRRGLVLRLANQRSGVDGGGPALSSPAQK
jgi:hypothetical protein